MLQTECLHTLPPPPKPPSEPPPEPLGDPEREPIGDPIPEPEETSRTGPDAGSGQRGAGRLSRPYDAQGLCRTFGALQFAADGAG